MDFYTKTLQKFDVSKYIACVFGDGEFVEQFVDKKSDSELTNDVDYFTSNEPLSFPTDIEEFENQPKTINCDNVADINQSTGNGNANILVKFSVKGQQSNLLKKTNVNQQLEKDVDKAHALPNLQDHILELQDGSEDIINNEENHEDIEEGEIPCREPKDKREINEKRSKNVVNNKKSKRAEDNEDIYHKKNYSIADRRRKSSSRSTSFSSTSSTSSSGSYDSRQRHKYRKSYSRSRSRSHSHGRQIKNYDYNSYNKRNRGLNQSKSYKYTDFHKRGRFEDRHKSDYYKLSTRWKRKKSRSVSKSKKKRGQDHRKSSPSSSYSSISYSEPESEIVERIVRVKNSARKKIEKTKVISENAKKKNISDNNLVLNVPQNANANDQIKKFENGERRIVKQKTEVNKNIITDNKKLNSTDTNFTNSLTIATATTTTSVVATAMSIRNMDKSNNERVITFSKPLPQQLSTKCNKESIIKDSNIVSTGKKVHLQKLPNPHISSKNNLLYEDIDEDYDIFTDQSEDDVDKNHENKISGGKVIGRVGNISIKPDTNAQFSKLQKIEKPSKKPVKNFDDHQRVYENNDSFMKPNSNLRRQTKDRTCTEKVVQDKKIHFSNDNNSRQYKYYPRSSESENEGYFYENTDLWDLDPLLVNSIQMGNGDDEDLILTPEKIKELKINQSTIQPSNNPPYKNREKSNDEFSNISVACKNRGDDESSVTSYASGKSSGRRSSVCVDHEKSVDEKCRNDKFAEDKHDGRLKHPLQVQNIGNEEIIDKNSTFNDINDMEDVEIINNNTSSIPIRETLLIRNAGHDVTNVGNNEPMGDHNIEQNWRQSEQEFQEVNNHSDKEGNRKDDDKGNNNDDDVVVDLNYSELSTNPGYNANVNQFMNEDNDITPKDDDGYNIGDNDDRNYDTAVINNETEMVAEMNKIISCYDNKEDDKMDDTGEKMDSDKLNRKNRYKIGVVKKSSKQKTSDSNQIDASQMSAIENLEGIKNTISSFKTLEEVINCCQLALNQAINISSRNNSGANNLVQAIEKTLKDVHSLKEGSQKILVSSSTVECSPNSFLPSSPFTNQSIVEANNYPGCSGLKLEKVAKPYNSIPNGILNIDASNTTLYSPQLLSPPPPPPPPPTTQSRLVVFPPVNTLARSNISSSYLNLSANNNNIVNSIDPTIVRNNAEQIYTSHPHGFWSKTGDKAAFYVNVLSPNDSLASSASSSSHYHSQFSHYKETDAIPCNTISIETELGKILKPMYIRGEITKEQYKEIMRKAVPKICLLKRNITHAELISNLQIYIDNVKR